MRYFDLSLIILLSVFISSCSSESIDGLTDNNDSTQVVEITNTIEKDFETITFKSKDGLDVTANKYEIDKSAPVIVLCHQARFNKFEYEGVAQRLNELGFNCIAIDQRSGGPIASEQNETFNLAREKNLGTDYLDAIPDIKAAVDFAADEYNQDVILWGSSYSSTLVLWEALSNDKVRAVVSFSPGDYFEELGSLTDSLATLDKPFFITAADFEIEPPGGLNDLLSKTTLGENQVVFKPESNGHHGSRALWKNQEGGEQYWEAVTPFLESLK